MRDSNDTELSKEGKERREGREGREGRGGGGEVRGEVVYVCRGGEEEVEEGEKGAEEGMEENQSQAPADRLRFESQFESGNLSQAIQM